MLHPAVAGTPEPSNQNVITSGNFRKRQRRRSIQGGRTRRAATRIEEDAHLCGRSYREAERLCARSDAAALKCAVVHTRLLRMPLPQICTGSRTRCCTWGLRWPRTRATSEKNPPGEREARDHTVRRGPRAQRDARPAPIPHLTPAVPRAAGADRRPRPPLRLSLHRPPPWRHRAALPPVREPCLSREREIARVRSSLGVAVVCARTPGRGGEGGAP